MARTAINKQYAPLGHRLVRIGIFLTLFFTSLSPLKVGRAGSESPSAQPPRVGSLATSNLTAGSTIYLPVVYAGGQPATSRELIEAALERGEIDEAMALVYKVYADFHDRRLPVIYQGADSTMPELTSLDEAVAAFDGLAVENQDLLLPFLVPPGYAGSWHEPGAEPQSVQPPYFQPDGFIVPPNRILLYQKMGELCSRAGISMSEWTYIDDPSQPFRVWYPVFGQGTQLESEAFQVFAELERVYPLVTGLMGREPLSDGGYPCDGGSGQIDVWVIDFIPNDPFPHAPYAEKVVDCANSSGYILWPNSNGDLDLLAHELMHVLLYGYNIPACEKDWWLHHGTATWIQDYVEQVSSPAGSGEHNAEHQYAPEFLKAPQLSLFYDETRINSPHIMRQYGAYLWPFFLANDPGNLDGAAIVRKIWEQAEADRHTDRLAAIDAALGGGLSESFDAFALENWNQGPVPDYQQWDGLKANVYNAEGSKVRPVEVNLAGQREWYYAMDYSIPSLAARYYHFVFNDPAVRSVMLNNRLYNSPKARVQVLAKIAGKGWEVREPSSSYSGNFFCRDAPADRLEEIVVIITNHEWQDRSFLLTSTVGATDVALEANNIGCRRWEGSVNYSREVLNGATMTLQAADVVLEAPVDQIANNRRGYALVQGTLVVTLSGSDGWCSYSGGPYTFDLAADYGGDILLQINQLNGGRADSSYTSYVGIGQSFYPIDYTKECNGTIYNNQVTYSYDWWNAPLSVAGEGPVFLTPDGRLADSYTGQDSNGAAISQSYTFSSPAGAP